MLPHYKAAQDHAARGYATPRRAGAQLRETLLHAEDFVLRRSHSSMRRGGAAPGGVEAQLRETTLHAEVL